MTEQVRLFGGIEGVPSRLRSGAITAQFVVLGDPAKVQMGSLRRSVDAALNREKRTHKLDPGDGWSLALRWTYAPKLEDEAQVIVSDIWGGHGDTVGTCRLVWPTAEVQMTPEVAPDPDERQRQWALAEMERAIDHLDAAIWLLLGVGDADPCYEALLRAQEGGSVSRLVERLKSELADLERVQRSLRKAL